MRPSILGDRQSRQAEIRGRKRVPFFSNPERGEHVRMILFWLFLVVIRAGFGFSRCFLELDLSKSLFCTWMHLFNLLDRFATNSEVVTCVGK